jgi:hypothetical protein
MPNFLATSYCRIVVAVHRAVDVPPDLDDLAAVGGLHRDLGQRVVVGLFQGRLADQEVGGRPVSLGGLRAGAVVVEDRRGGRHRPLRLRRRGEPVVFRLEEGRPVAAALRPVAGLGDHRATGVGRGGGEAGGPQGLARGAGAALLDPLRTGAPGQDGGRGGLVIRSGRGLGRSGRPGGDLLGARRESRSDTDGADHGDGKAGG